MARKRKPNPLYEDFHGKPPQRVRRANLPVPNPGETLVVLGRLTHVVYQPYGNSQYAGTHFEHKMGDTGYKVLKDKPLLCTDKQGKNLYIVPDKAKPHVTERGIIG